jgi:tRNA A37 threonylcarbamoyladenosine biosynthesis protein TsaE
MPKAVEVFTPNDTPTFTYVDRATHQFEQRLRNALEIPKMVVSVSGPSKSGKTVLVKKVLQADNLIQVWGSSIR